MKFVVWHVIGSEICRRGKAHLMLGINGIETSGL